MVDSGGSKERTRVALVYKHKLLRDLALSILNTADVDVVAVIDADDPLLDVLAVVHPDVVIVDQAATSLFGHLSQVTIASSDPAGPSRMVTIGLADTTMVVCRRVLVPNVNAQTLLDVVLDESASGLQSDGL